MDQDALLYRYIFYDDYTYQIEGYYYYDGEDISNQDTEGRIGTYTYDIIDEKSIKVDDMIYYITDDYGLVTEVVHTDYDPSRPGEKYNTERNDASYLFVYDKELPIDDAMWILDKGEEYVDWWINTYKKDDPTYEINILSDDDVLEGITNYINEHYEYEGDVPFYWVLTDQSESTRADEITVDFRSYTAAHVFYHVNIYTGDVRTTEWVPMITDGEVEGTVKFNIYEYLDR